MTGPTLEQTPQSHSYRVERRGGCVLIYGALPITDLVALSSSRGGEEVMSPDVARMAGANIAFGTQEALDQLRESLKDAALQREASAHPDLEADLVRWLAIGERGRSSDAVVNHLTGALGGKNAEDRFAFPHDPDDLRRCRLLLEQVPFLAARFHEHIGRLSQTWSRLAARWSELCDTMDAEAPEWRGGKGRAPRTCELMRRLVQDKPS